MTLDVGDVFSGYNYVLSGQKSHYYLVVHKTTQNQLIVVYFTTSLEKTYKACRRDEADLAPRE